MIIFAVLGNNQELQKLLLLWQELTLPHHTYVFEISPSKCSIPSMILKTFHHLLLNHQQYYFHLHVGLL